MRWLVSLIVVIVVAVLVGLTARYAQGYVLFVMPRTRVEMSLTLFVLLLVFGFAFFYALVRTARHLWHLPARLQAYRLHRRRNRARSAMQDAMSAYLEGHFERAEKAAAKAMRLQESPQLASALAAHAAQALGRAEQSEQYLAFGESETQQVSRLLQMTRANLLHQSGAHAQALNLLGVVQAQAPRYLPALRLALQCCLSLQQWAQADKLCAELKQLGAGDEPQVRQAQQTLAKLARDALISAPTASGATASAEVVALRPRQSGS